LAVIILGITIKSSKTQKNINSLISKTMPNAADKIKVGVAMVLENLQGKSMGNN
jgi:hypothetical protein